MNISEYAGQLQGMFQDGSREAVHHGGKVRVLSDDAPDWLRDLCYRGEGVTTSDFHIEAVEAMIDAISDGDIEPEPALTQAHSRAGYLALAHDRDLQAEVDRLLEEGVTKPLSQLIGDAATAVMNDIFTDVWSEMQANLPEPDEDGIEP